MGISFLRPFLHSLCCNSPWSYAVFWKLEHQHEMILVWEDGFYDIPKPSYSMAKQIEGFYLESSNMIYPYGFSSSGLVGTPWGDPVGFAVAEMSSASHVVGDGVIGKVAFTGNACWMYSDSIATDIFDSDFVPEYEKEWSLQFAAGIKTILLLPVLPHGVLQLGSVEMVPENEALTSYIKDKFQSLDKPGGYDWRYPIQQFSFTSAFIDGLEEPSTVTTETVFEDQNAIHAVGITDCNLISGHMMPFPAVQDFCNRYMREGKKTPENVIESDDSQHALGLIHVAESSYQLSCEEYKSLLAKDDNVTHIHNEDISKASPYSESSERMFYENFVNELMDYPFNEGVTGPALVNEDFDSGICESEFNFFSFLGDFELHKALGTTVNDSIYEYNCGTAVSSQDVDRCSNGKTEPLHGMKVLGVESDRFQMKEVEDECLLQAAVSISGNSFDHSSPNNSDLTSSSLPSEKHLTSSKRCSQSELSTSVKQDMTPCNILASAFIAHGINSASDLSALGSSVECKVSVYSEKKLSRKSSDSLKVGKLSSTCKKKSRGGHNQRTRPRDRQLIQDRIKELRDLVPNSEKSSIDGLLDKTIKHMLFLRSVTDQADKLRHQDLKEESDRKRKRSAEVNYDNQNGTSWAVEVGSEQNLCPIVVKDLDHPGHMLIEMLCDDHGRFLQIADVIHRSQLTILKGVMEKDTDNSLARFVVETSGSFHRLDIFWPLMKLLQQTQPPISVMAH